MSFKLTAGNVDDRAVVEKMCTTLSGWLFGDQGYLSGKLCRNLKERGLDLITKSKKNMSDQIMTKTQKQWLEKRGVIESAIDQLKVLLHIQHPRHRSRSNFLGNLFVGIIAYIFKPQKPSVSFANHLNCTTVSYLKLTLS